MFIVEWYRSLRARLSRKKVQIESAGFEALCADLLVQLEATLDSDDPRILIFINRASPHYNEVLRLLNRDRAPGKAVVWCRFASPSNRSVLSHFYDGHINALLVPGYNACGLNLHERYAGSMHVFNFLDRIEQRVQAEGRFHRFGTEARPKHQYIMTHFTESEPRNGWPFTSRPEWEYGIANGMPARRHRKNGNVQFVLWKAGQQGHNEDFWFDMHLHWWSSFRPNPETT